MIFFTNVLSSVFVGICGMITELLKLYNVSIIIHLVF